MKVSLAKTSPAMGMRLCALLSLAAGAWLLMVGSVVDGSAAEARTPRLAVLVEAPWLGVAADLLTVELSKRPEVVLVERTEIQRVYDEQARAAASKDYVKLGQVLGAQGLLLLELDQSEAGVVLSTRLVAVAPGVVLELTQAPWPQADIAGWAGLIVRRISPLFPKLGVLSRNAVPVSMLNLRSALQSRDAGLLDQTLTTLLAHRLMQQPEVFVLERRRLEALDREKDLKEAEATPFWGGSYLLEGTIDAQGFSKDTLRLGLRLSPPKGGAPIDIELAGPRTNLAGVAAGAAAEVLARLSPSAVAAEWKPEEEAERYFEEAKWALRWKQYGEAQSASEASWALGRMADDTASLRIRAYAEGAEQALSDLGLAHFKASLSADDREPGRAALAGPAILAAIGRSLEVLLEASRLFPAGKSASGQGWCELAELPLELAAQVLRSYLASPEETRKREPDLEQLRLLCQEVSLLYEATPRLRETCLDVHKLRARHGGLWLEDPAASLAALRALFNGPLGDPVRRDFLAWRLTQRVRQPFLLARRAADQNRLAALWRAFLDEMAASPRAAMRLDAAFLGLTEATTGPEFEVSARGVFNIMLQERVAVSTFSEQFDYHTELVEFVTYWCGFAFTPPNTWSYPPPPEKTRVLEQWFPEFERKWQAATPPAGVESSPADHVAPPVWPQTPPTGSVRAPDIAASSSANGRGRGLAPASAPPDVKEILTEDLVVERFWLAELPVHLFPAGSKGPSASTEPDRRYLFFRQEMAGVRYREGRVWIALFATLANAGRGVIHAVDPVTLESQCYVLPWSWSVVDEPDPSRPQQDSFDVLGRQLYVAWLGQVKRLDLQSGAWADIATRFQGDARVTAVRDRVYVCSDDSVLEINPRTLEVRPLASARRRPALNALDELDRLAFPTVWRGGDHLRLHVPPHVYQLDEATGQWETLATVAPLRGQRVPRPYGDSESVTLFPSEMTQGRRLLLSLSGEARVPEALLEEPWPVPNLERFLGAQGDRRTNVARWMAPPQRKLVFAAAHFDGTNLWCLAPLNQAGWAEGMMEMLKPGDFYSPRLTQFATGRTAAISIPLKLRWNIPAAFRGGRAGVVTTQPRLLPTPAGFVVVDQQGLWLLPKEAVEKRLADAQPLQANGSNRLGASAHP